MENQGISRNELEEVLQLSYIGTIEAMALERIDLSQFLIYEKLIPFIEKIVINVSPLIKSESDKITPSDFAKLADNLAKSSDLIMEMKPNSIKFNKNDVKRPLTFDEMKSLLKDFDLYDSSSLDGFNIDTNYTIDKLRELDKKNGKKDNYSSRDFLLRKKLQNNLEATGFSEYDIEMLTPSYL